MNPRRLLLAAATASLTTASARAQVDYSHNWQTMNYGFNGSVIAAPSTVLYGAIVSGAGNNYGGVGDSIRICYGVDAMQGGTHESGSSALTWFELWGGHTAAASSNNSALVSAVASTYDAASGDACFSPLFLQSDPASGAPLNRFDSLAFAFFNLNYGGPGPFPAVWQSIFQLGGNGAQVENIKGSDPNGLFGGEPLLTHLVLEIQGPLNESLANVQYYLATTDEVVGLNGGGVTNGNLSMGEGLFGLGYTADITGAVVHHRLTSFDAAQGILGGVPTLGFGGVAADQWWGGVALETPFVWAGNDVDGLGNLNTGAGGMDWSISQSVSSIRLRCLDMLSGAEVAGTGLDLNGGPASSVTDPFIGASLPYFLFSATPAVGTFQRPCGWCDLGGLIPMQAGDPVLGLQATKREGLQSVPICFDTLTQSFLSQAAFALGTNFRGAYDGFGPDTGAQFQAPNVNPATGAAWAFDSIAGSGVGLDIAGSAGMAAALPIGAAPNASLAGLKLCVTAALIEAAVNPSTGGLEVGINEIAGVTSINLQ